MINNKINVDAFTLVHTTCTDIRGFCKHTFS